MAWSIELVPQRNSSSQHAVKRTGVSIFRVGECWGFDKFYFVQELERDGFVSSEDQALVFRLALRCYDYQVCHALSAAHADTLARKVCLLILYLLAWLCWLGWLGSCLALLGLLACLPAVHSFLLQASELEHAHRQTLARCQQLEAQLQSAQLQSAQLQSAQFQSAQLQSAQLQSAQRQRAASPQATSEPLARRLRNAVPSAPVSAQDSQTLRYRPQQQVHLPASPSPGSFANTYPVSNSPQAIPATTTMAAANQPPLRKAGLIGSDLSRPSSPLLVSDLGAFPNKGSPERPSYTATAPRPAPRWCEEDDQQLLQSLKQLC